MPRISLHRAFFEVPLDESWIMSGKPFSIDLALRKAQALAGQGEADKARQVCRAILAKFPSNKRALAMLGALQARRPPQRQRTPVSATLQAELNALIALHRQGRLDDVLERAAGLAGRLPDNPLIPNIMGASHAAKGCSQAAIASFEKALKIDPGFFPAHNNLGAALAAEGRETEAIACYATALNLKPDYADAHNNLGNALRKLGRLGEAAVSYRRALEIRADFPDAHSSLGATLHDLGHEVEAIEHYAIALQLAPGNAMLHNNLGVALNALGKHDEAIASYREALRLRPGLPEAYNNLCELYEKANRIDDLRNAVSLAQAGSSRDHPHQRYWLAEIAGREGRHADARDHLEAIAPERLALKMRLKHSELLSKTYDRLNQFDRAFSQFAETNRLAAKWQSFRDYDPLRYVDELVDLKQSWSAAPRVDWAPADLAGPGISLAFMVGFPRSGTTLLDTVLRCHPDIAVVEEKPMMERVRNELGGRPTFDALNSLDQESTLRLRAAYLDELRRHLGDAPAGRLVIDKLPLNLVDAGLIHRVFPEAKFILVLRHPCDCVLSCFMQNFRLNDAMANFLELEQAARLYDLAMALWKDYHDKLGLDVGCLKYEDLVVDLRSATEPLLRFLGLDWDDNLLNYREAALSRGRINTPSYRQVTQKLYTRARGRWENYRTRMAPVLPILEPWSAAWGYATRSPAEASAQRSGEAPGH